MRYGSEDSGRAQWGMGWAFRHAFGWHGTEGESFSEPEPWKQSPGPEGASDDGRGGYSAA